MRHPQDPAIAAYNKIHKMGQSPAIQNAISGQPGQYPATQNAIDGQPVQYPVGHPQYGQPVPGYGQPVPALPLEQNGAKPTAEQKYMEAMQARNSDPYMKHG